MKCCSKIFSGHVSDVSDNVSGVSDDSYDREGDVNDGGSVEINQEMRAKQGGEEALKWQKKVDEGKKRLSFLMELILSGF